MDQLISGENRTTCRSVVGRISLRLAALLIPFFVICPILMMNFPMVFFDGEYGWYRQNQDYSKQHEDYCRVMLLGDSTSKAAWLPEELSNDTYNFALGGVSPIEEYCYLREYLEQNDAPEYVIYTQSISHFIEAETLWSRSVYFHRMAWKDLQEIIENARVYEDTAVLEENNIPEQIFQYWTYSPVKYSSAMAKVLLNPWRGRINRERYESAAAAKGQTQFGDAEFSDDVYTFLVELETFEVDVLIDVYLRRTIELCRERGISFIFQAPPLNESTYACLQEPLVQNYTAYMEKLQKDYPEAVIDTKLQYYENGYFGDPSHLNKRGSIAFSQNMRKKYQFVFDGT